MMTEMRTLIEKRGTLLASSTSTISRSDGAPDQSTIAPSIWRTTTRTEETPVSVSASTTK
jgi:hypothetical protein